MQTGNELSHPEGVASPAPKQSIWSRMGNVFWAPTKAFEGFAGGSGAIIPLLIVTIILVAIASYPAGMFQGMDQVKLLENSSSIPPAALEEMRQNAMNPTLWHGPVFGPPVVLIMTLISALIAWVVGGFLMGGEKVGFGTIWGVGLLSGLISLVGGLIKAPLMIVKETAQITLGPAALFPDMQPTAIFFWILSYLDLFAIWAVIVAGLGYAAIFKLSTGKGMAVSIIGYVILVSIISGLQLIGLMFAGVDVTFF